MRLGIGFVFLGMVSAVQSADVECVAGPGPLAAGAGAPLDPRRRVRLCFTSRRHRLADSDGVSYKGIIDGLVLAGVLEDDGPAFVSGVEMRQEKVGAKECEETIVEIYEEEA